MNTATVTFTTDTASGNLNDIFIHSNPNLAVCNMQNYLSALVSGNADGSVNVKINTGNAVAASGTLTSAAVAATNTAVINGVTLTAVDGREKTTITAGPDIAGSLNDTYFLFSDAGDVHKYYVWYNIDAAGTDPLVTGRVGIEVAGAEDATASTLGGATRTAITTTAGAYVTVTGATTSVVIQNILPGVTTATADGAAPTGFTIARTITGAAVSAVQFQIDASNTTTATNLAAAINAQASLLPFIVATPSLAVVTVSAIIPGVLGNAITLAATGNITANVTRLAGGTNDSGSTTYNFGR